MNFSENLIFLVHLKCFQKKFTDSSLLSHSCLKGRTRKSLRLLYGSVFQQCVVGRSPVELFTAPITISYKKL